MTQRFTSMIAGDSAPTGTVEVVAPFDRTPIATIETCGAEGVEQALATPITGSSVVTSVVQLLLTTRPYHELAKAG